jgi:MFS superfamily sulfate permease-like transporter
MNLISRRTRFYFLSFLKHDFKASITVFFVALPLCLGISLASGAPVYSGLLAGIIGGLVISFISGSELSVSGPAAGLTAISVAAIHELGGLEIFFLAVALAGILQILLGIFRLGGFTHFIPSAVIKGMLAAIGILLISKQIPLLVGYNQPDFWTNQFFNILTFHHAFDHITNLYQNTSAGTIIIALLSLGIGIIWTKKISEKIPFLPGSFIIVFCGILLAIFFQNFFPSIALKSTQYVTIPENIFSQISFLILILLFPMQPSGKMRLSFVL